MGRLLLNWLVSAVSLIIVAHIVPGIVIEGFFTALIAALVIGLVNATLGLVLKILTFPLTIVTLGIFWWIINALMLWFASALFHGHGFEVRSFFAAFFGAIVLALVNMALRWILPSGKEAEQR
jgi:putative membrane protein